MMLLKLINLVANYDHGGIALDRELIKQTDQALFIGTYDLQADDGLREQTVRVVKQVYQLFVVWVCFKGGVNGWVVGEGLNLIKSNLFNSLLEHVDLLVYNDNSHV